MKDDNPLRSYVDAHRTGRGIWKCTEYFDVYHHHFQKFRGTPVRVLEIGVYSGGSLEMWKDYFGSRSHLYGVDIQESCRKFEDAQTSIFIGDQGDETFWNGFKKDVPALDIIIDDGSHNPEHQRVTFDALLPHLNPGGVYLCEDLNRRSPFLAYLQNLAADLSADEGLQDNKENPERRIVLAATPWQSMIQAVHVYPFIVVVEKRSTPVTEFVAPKRGTEWEGFLA